MDVLVHIAASVNSLTSFETELPYEYYTMPFCKPPEVSFMGHMGLLTRHNQHACAQVQHQK